MKFQPVWSTEEVTVAWAACPKEHQNYNKTDLEILEIADLLNRSPSAVSTKFGNCWAVWERGKGLSHASRTVHEVVNRYRNDLPGLVRDANEIRERMRSRTSSVRAEVTERSFTRERVDQFVQLRVEASRLGLPQYSLVVYTREGSVILGFAVDPAVVLQEMEAVATLLTLAWEVLGPLRESLGFELARRGARQAFAEVWIKDTMPEFHGHELSGRDRFQLAVELSRFRIGKLSSVKVLRGRLRHIDYPAERQRIRSYFHISARKLCEDCVVLLTAAVNSSMAGRSKRPRYPHR